MNCLRGVQIATALASAAIIMMTGGCGYKNQPVPPESVIPVAIDDLRYTNENTGVKLTWTYPVETVRGKTLNEIDKFEIYLADVPVKDYCGTCPVPFGQPIAMPGGESSVQGKKKTATYDLPNLVAGHKYFFKVRSRTSWWVSSDDSNIVSLVWQQPVAGPQGLTAKAMDKQISLKWQPVSNLKDGTKAQQPVQYQVLRSGDGKEFAKIGEPVSTTSFVDRDVRNNQKYLYKVQALLKTQNEYSAGGETETVAASPVDQPKLLPPTGVGVAETAAGNKIFWDKSKEEKLGGYRIYRRSANKDAFELLDEVKPDFNLYIDKTAKEGSVYFYVVTTISAETPVVESAYSREASSRR